jgi:hypothetical protein
MVLAVHAFLLLFLMGRMTIQVLFERGQCDAAAGGLTYEVLLAYAVLTNTVQLAGRALLMVLWVQRLGVVAIPAALAVTATGEMLIQGIVLLLRLRSRIASVLRLGKKPASGR